MRKVFKIHILLAKTFLQVPQENNNYQVDHIDRNRNNYSISNLRWVTASDNLKNRKPWKLKNNCLDSKIISINYSSSNMKTIWKSGLKCTINFCCIRMDDYEIKKINRTPEDYLCNWVRLPDDSSWISSGGIVLRTKRNIKGCIGSITFGKLNNQGYYVCSVGPSCCRLHRLVAKYFISNGHLLEEDKDYIVDHINCDRSDNRYSNLRVVSRKENHQNLITLLNRSRPVVGISKDTGDTLKFDSCKDAYVFLGKNHKTSSGISKSCKTGSNYCGYVWKYYSKDGA